MLQQIRWRTGLGTNCLKVGTRLEGTEEQDTAVTSLDRSTIWIVTDFDA